jgi:hypothetical protein
MCTPIFIAVLAIHNRRKGELVKCPMEYNLVFKKGKSFVTLADLEDIMLSEMSQSRRNYHVQYHV